jgi:thymidylate synthase/tetrahydromethanopterin S-methyltransferase subunit A
MKTIKIGYDKHLEKDVKKLVFDKIPDKKIFSSEDVIFGNPNSNIAIAFVYNWKSDKAPKEVHELFVKLSNYAAVTGYWRTTNGGKYVFSNILSNPNINKLVVFVFDKEDNGHLLVDALRNLWVSGVNEDGIIINSKSPNPKFEGINNVALLRATTQSDLIILKNIKDLLIPEELIKSQIQEPENAIPTTKFENLEFYSNYADNNLMYDDGCRFDDHLIIDFSSTTKEVNYDETKSNLSQSIEVDDLDEAADQVAAFIFNYGDLNKDQRGIQTFEYRSFSLTVKDALSKIPTNFSEEYLQKYVKEFIEGVGEGLDDFAYTYHERIFKRWGNQVEKITSILKNDHNTRRALISLWDQTKDLDSANPPCLDFIWPCIRNNKLEFHIVYRSHHLATITKEGNLVKGEGALVPNLYAIATLQKKVAKDLNIERGYLYLTDFSGHLYVAEK